MSISEHEHEGLLTIDLGAVVDNYSWLRQHLVNGGRCAGVVKADAYGLGVGEVAPALYRAGCRDFFVATLAEGEQLRNLLPAEVTIYLLTGVRPGSEQRCAAANLVPVLVTIEQLRQWCALTASSGLAAPCALKVDTGMTRLGMGGDEFAQLLQMPELLAGANLQLILSHLACADEPDHPQNPAQLAVFNEFVSGLRRICPGVQASFANSSGICLGEAYHFDLVRPGSALYGINPLPGRKNPMRPVVSLRVPVLQQREITRDSAVGYGAAGHAAAGSWLAVVRGGYADGILRTQSGRGRGMAVAGDEKIAVPMLGRVSMDTCVFDISALSEDQRHRLEVIELLGDDWTVDDMATAAGTIGYEILTSLGRRYCRRYL
ncbi:alanine racemase [Microbulbifer pacificus]|uniref:Alanine racemase n=1 Tax=Microbulbifer pacificus TaxID=407164 RepID=A0AAU0N3T0_9GAMM|nr:alanine racemase [Microbulbifer pacificus]WOX06779.1 alanine racemase [Microbulbifer pacificus]